MPADHVPRKIRFRQLRMMHRERGQQPLAQQQLSAFCHPRNQRELSPHMIPRHDEEAVWISRLHFIDETAECLIGIPCTGKPAILQRVLPYAAVCQTSRVKSILLKRKQIRAMIRRCIDKVKRWDIPLRAYPPPRLFEKKMVVDPEPGARCIRWAYIGATVRRIKAECGDEMRQAPPVQSPAIPERRTIAKTLEDERQSCRQRVLPEEHIFVQLQVRIVDTGKQTRERRL